MNTQQANRHWGCFLLLLQEPQLIPKGRPVARPNPNRQIPRWRRKEIGIDLNSLLIWALPTKFRIWNNFLTTRSKDHIWSLCSVLKMVRTQTWRWSYCGATETDWVIMKYPHWMVRRFKKLKRRHFCSSLFCFRSVFLPSPIQELVLTSLWMKWQSLHWSLKKKF